MSEKKPLTTEDLARSGDDMRGHQSEQMVDQANTAIAEPERRPLAPPDQPRVPRQPRDVDREERTPLFTGEEADRFRNRWNEIQTNFVDEPRRSVEDADGVVAEMMKRLAETFARERNALEHQWDRGDNVTTEDLRVALQRYRSFFGRLLSV